MDLETCANLIFHAASILEPAGLVEISRATDGAGGFYIKAFGMRGEALGVLSNA